MLHPSYKLQQFKDRQSSSYPSQVSDMFRIVQDTYQSYKDRLRLTGEVQSMLSNRELIRIEQFNTIKNRKKKAKNELQRYLDSPLDEEHIDLLSQYKAYKGVYPVLSNIAFNLLVAPAMSAKCECLFLVAKWVVNNERLRTLNNLIESS